MAHTLLTVAGYAKRLAFKLKNQCVMGNLVYRGLEEEWQTKLNGYKRGQTINVELPMYSVVADGSDCSSTKVDFNMRSIAITLSYRKHIAHTWSELEATYQADMLDRKFIDPDAESLANYIDTEILVHANRFANQVGIPGTTPTSFRPIDQAKSYLDMENVPSDNRRVVINSDYEVELRDRYRSLLHQGMVESAVRKGSFNQKFNGMDGYVSQNVHTHTCGTAAGVSGFLVQAAVSEGDATIGFDQGGSALTLTQGDIFTVNDCFAVGPINHNRQARSRQFVMGEAVTFTDLGGGNFGDTSMLVTPGTSPYTMYSAGASSKFLPYQNMEDAAGTAGVPKNNAAVTIAGSAGASSPLNLAFHRDALALCMVPIRVPQSFKNSKNTHTENFDGFVLTVTRYGDGDTLTDTIRIDVLFAIQVLNPFMGCRIAG
tara:strand:+ start:4350 stop:5639 length:1290 start_codon:yes stop_codon:yes gene_type:complete